MAAHSMPINPLQTYEINYRVSATADCLFPLLLLLLRHPPDPSVGATFPMAF